MAKYLKDKTEFIGVRLDPLNMAKLEALAKDRGVTRSEMLRIILEDVVRGRVNSETGEVHLVTQADMERKYVGHDTGME